jgi:prepilin-type N-terminal cleavage/methylation domain-containing protein
MTNLDFRRDDRGFTLIELLASSLIFAAIFTVIGSIFISLVRTQESVEATTQTTNVGQLIARSIDDGIRNSSGFQLSTIGDDQLLTARTASSGAALTWTCVAWYYAAGGDGSIRTFSSSTAIATPSAAQLANWTLLIEGVDPRVGSTVFSVTGPRLDVAFDALADGQNPTAIEFSVAPPAGITEASC